MVDHIGIWTNSLTRESYGCLSVVDFQDWIPVEKLGQLLIAMNVCNGMHTPKIREDWLYEECLRTVQRRLLDGDHAWAMKLLPAWDGGLQEHIFREKGQLQGWWSADK